jgi:branched-chain amino acid transport system permease protein
MNFTMQLLIAGLAIGSVYSLIALGIVLIYKCSGVVNFGQGGFLVLGAYLTYALKAVELPTPFAVGGSVVAMAIVGTTTERLMLRPMTRAPLVAVMMATLGLMILIDAVCLMIWGSDQRAYPRLFPDGAMDVFGIFITYNYIAAGTLSICLSLGFLGFYHFTSLGLMQRCTADNGKAALAVGIHTGNQNCLAWSMSAALAGMGGTLLATLNGLSPSLGDIGLAAFPVVVLGGLNSLAGAVVAGLMLGVLQTFAAGMLTPVLEQFLRAHTGLYSIGALEHVVPYCLLVVILLVRPQGIFGRKGTERL